MQETNSYKGWLNSDSFLKRVIGVWGHAMIGQLFIGLIILVLMLVFGGAAFFNRS